MAGEKRFGTAMFGFNKSDVNSYIEKLLKEIEDRLKDKDEELLTIKNQNREIRLKYEDLVKRADQINEDRAKIADVLIKAQEKADLIVDDARVQAVDEKKKLEEMIEQERERLVDLKQELRLLKSEVIDTLKKYEGQLTDIIKENDIGE